MNCLSLFSNANFLSKIYSGILLLSVSLAFASGEQELIDAVHADNAQSVKNILAQHGNINLEVRDFQDDTPLMIAADKGNFEIALALLEKGAKIDTKNHAGATAMMLAVFGRNTQLMQELTKRCPKCVDATSNHGDTALDFARMTGQTEMTKILEKAKTLKSEL